MANNENLRRGGPGRPKGSRNERSKEIEAVAQGILRNRAYQKSLRDRLYAGTAPHMETLLHHYAYGKPIERLRIAGEHGGPLEIVDPFMMMLQQLWSREPVENGADANGHEPQALP